MNAGYTRCSKHSLCESKQKHQWKMTNASTHLNIYKLSRRGRKLQVSDDVRTLVALPKEVPERTWAEILQREENDLVVFDIREEIVEMALQTGYTRYMERQNALFTAHCAAQAWLKLIDWHFYRHDPGEEPSSAPACYIPKREQSWQPDALPEPSPKDTWGHHELVIVEDASDEVLVKWPSNSSIDMPLVEEIPEEYWFPGKVNLPDLMREKEEKLQRTLSYESSASENLVADSELLQKVTDYSSDDLSPKESAFSALKTTTPVDGSLQGAGDSKVAVPRTHHQTTDRSKSFSSRASVAGRSRALLQPLDSESKSRISIISDCRLRNLRMETQYEVSSEKVDTPPGESVKRK